MSEAMIDDMLDALIPAVEQLPDWDGVLQRARRAHHRRVALFVAMAALVIVPAAYAVVRAFEGTPGPPQIRAGFRSWNREASLVTQRGFRVHVPHAIVASAHGVLQVQTSDGPLDLWAARSDAGGICWFVDYESDLRPHGPPAGGGSCDQGHGPPGRLTYELDWTIAHPTLETLLGRVYTGASIVRITLSNGSTVSLPVVEGLYLASVPNHTRIRRADAFDAAGKKVASFSVPGARRGAP